MSSHYCQYISDPVISFTFYSTPTFINWREIPAKHQPGSWLSVFIFDGYRTLTRPFSTVALAAISTSWQAGNQGVRTSWPEYKQRQRRLDNRRYAQQNHALQANSPSCLPLTGCQVSQGRRTTTSCLQTSPCQSGDGC